MYTFCGKPSPSPSPSPSKVGRNSKAGGDLKKKKKKERKVPGGSSEKHTQTLGLFPYLFKLCATTPTITTTNITTTTTKLQLPEVILLIFLCSLRGRAFFFAKKDPLNGRGVLKDKEKKSPRNNFYAHFGQIWGRGGELKWGGTNPENITAILLGGKTLPRVFQSSVVSY